jgi:hypothetical protein
MAFKVIPIAPEHAVLRRMSWLQRTVRYEWRDNGALVWSPVFEATAQEWERARD